MLKMPKRVCLGSDAKAFRTWIPALSYKISDAKALSSQKLRAAWRTESGELFFNIQLPSASHRCPALPSVFLCTSFNFSDPFFSFLRVPSVLFCFLLPLSASFCVFLLPRASSTFFNFLLPFLLPSATFILSASCCIFLLLPASSVVAVGSCRDARAVFGLQTTAVVRRQFLVNPDKP